MAEQRETLTAIPVSLVEALRLALALTPQSEGEKAAQREMVIALENALRRAPAADHRQRVEGQLGQMERRHLPGGSHPPGHRVRAQRQPPEGRDRDGGLRPAAVMSISIVLAQDRPFSGQLGVGPDVLLQVAP
jgi:hypothetical protein